jgi:acetate kinase
MATSLPSLDAVVFTGGIGEHAAPVRSRIVTRVGVLGVERRGAGEAAASPAGDAVLGSRGDAVLSARGNRPAVLRVIAREDLVIAEAAASLLG